MVDGRDENFHLSQLSVNHRSTMHDEQRRRFLMQTALIAAAAPLAGAGVLAQTPKKKLGVALCGLGGLSTNQIAPALQKTTNCQLTAVVSGDRQVPVDSPPSLSL